MEPSAWAALAGIGLTLGGAILTMAMRLESRMTRLETIVTLVLEGQGVKAG